jgi:hypothetical protein
MKFVDCVKNISTSIELKRISSAYIVDCKTLGKDEYSNALIKNASQYYLLKNVTDSYNALLYSEKRDERILVDIFLKEILLNQEDYRCEQKKLDEAIISYENDIINLSNELDIKELDNDKKLFNFVLETAWEQNNSISPDEKNLLEKLRIKLNITLKEFQILEAKLSKFPKENNETHLRNEIDKVRISLQQKGLIFAIRNADNIDYDVIPEEIAQCLKTLYGKQMRDFGYRKLLTSKYLRNKDYLQSVIAKADIQCSPYLKLSELQEIIFNKINPSVVLGGYSPKDGLEKETLMEWCADLKLTSYGTKNELINRIIEYYDEIKEIQTDTSDSREVYFNVFEDLASRNMKFLRQQGIISKDLECEHKFEEATNYIFEKLLKQKPLLLTGTDHPDGILSYQNKLIMWDNKSKETPVKLKDHIYQFDKYIKNSEKPVAVFIVIGPDFTEESINECINYSLNSDTLILLLKAADLKEIASKWAESHKQDNAPFNLGYFKQNGLFNKNLINI